jgi:hypothetical protein
MDSYSFARDTNKDGEEPTYPFMLPSLRSAPELSRGTPLDSRNGAGSWAPKPTTFIVL